MAKLYSYPPQSVAVSIPPLEFRFNNIDTQVSRDTVTTSNSRPLPTISLDSTGAAVTPLTDSQLRASPVPVSQTSQPLPAGAATESTLSSLNAKQSTFDLDTGAGTQNVQGVSLRKSAAGGSVELGTSSDPVRVDPTGTTTQPISAASLPLPAGASTLAEQQTQSTRLGDVLEVAPATDTASSGINGRLQRIAQRLTSLISLLPLSLGQKLMAGSLAVTIASDQSAVPVSGPLTDVQLRATAVPVSGPLTDTQLRATAVPVSLASSPSPAVNGGAITNTQKAVGTSAVRATVDGLAPNANRKKLILKSSADNTGRIWFGSSTVTTANGVEIIGPDRLEFEFDSGDYYLISDVAGQKVEILEKI